VRSPKKKESRVMTGEKKYGQVSSVGSVSRDSFLRHDWTTIPPGADLSEAHKAQRLKSRCRGLDLMDAPQSRKASNGGGIQQ
jgi:hypothetical protein